jgi:predicted alpha/beta-hydrolase family hydrolase
MTEPPRDLIPVDERGVRGFVHAVPGGASRGLVLTHGAGGACDAPLLIALAEAFRRVGVAVLRCDLPFRQRRPKGPPSPATAEADRAGLQAAVAFMRERCPDAVWLGGHSYGGRQASLLAAEAPALADRLLLLSYPLHPPDKPLQLRTSHFPGLRTRALFVHGSRDPFGSIDAMKSALALVPGDARLLPVEGAGHDLARGAFDLDAVVAALAT